jgi:general secretion pathway protein M
MKSVALLREFWMERSDRERQVLAGTGLFVLLAALYAFLWEPGLAARERLATALPNLRAQVEDMRAQQREIAALRKKIGASPRVADPLPAIRATAAGTLGSSLARVESLPGGKVLVSSPALDFDVWLAWIAALQRDFGVHLETCSLVALPQPGQVRVEATFVTAMPPGRL